ncbi:hypothetical protein KEJ39_00750 [Candidatus Bathyarchaeota archaeon]|nr:hypothetical protein [Candidatus Bathyarchaeota archaeon]
MGLPTSKEKAENTTLAFSRVACSDVSIRIMLLLEKNDKGASREELMRQSLAGNEGIFEYSINELVRSGLVSSDSPYVLTSSGKEIVRKLRSVLP